MVGYQGRAAGIVALLALLLAAAQALAGPTAERRRGAVDGLWYWQLPAAPSGTRPIQSWSGPGATPDGTIFIAGMDHVTNSVLYRLPVGDAPATRPGRTLFYVGDARAASRSAGTWRAGDVAEKFHTRPTWDGSAVWVATLNDSTLSDAYLSKNGFRWYRHDRATDRLVDRGLGAARGGLVAMTLDPVRRAIYGTMLPTGDLYRLDLAAGTTQALGRPAFARPYVYAGRALWVDRAGRVYFTAGNVSPGNGAPYDSTIFGHVHYWDPATGFGERTDWPLPAGNATDMVQCFPTTGTCWLGDDRGNLYRFDDASGATAARWAPLPRAAVAGRIRVMHVSADQRRAYLVATTSELFAVELATSRVVARVRLGDLDPMLSRPQFYGHDAWDRNGRFYLAAFGTLTASYDTLLVAIDPLRLFRAIGRPL